MSAPRRRPGRGGRGPIVAHGAHLAGLDRRPKCAWARSVGQPARQLEVTPQEYLAFERASAEKPEYVDGEIFAMAGGAREHSLVGHNVEVELGTALQERPCEAARLRREDQDPGGKHHHADGFVLCGPPVFEDETRDVILNPGRGSGWQHGCEIDGRRSMKVPSV